MKLGVFDSGLGGLLIAKSIRESLPDIDMVYFGDTLHLPYGNRSPEAIYEYSRRAMEFLFAQDCALIIVACNTVSASVLRQLQQIYLPQSRYANRRILGVVVPTLECAIEKGYKNIGLIATNHTVSSNVYKEELIKINPDIKLHQCSTPLLVPLIENDGMKWIEPILKEYLNPLKNKNIECLILGCTHYVFLKEIIATYLSGADILSQDEIIPDKLEDYLRRHPEISNKISRKAEDIFYVSDITEGYIKAAQQLYGANIHIRLASLSLNDNSYHEKVFA